MRTHCAFMALLLLLLAVLLSGASAHRPNRNHTKEHRHGSQQGGGAPKSGFLRAAEQAHLNGEAYRFAAIKKLRDELAALQAAQAGGAAANASSEGINRRFLQGGAAPFKYTNPLAACRTAFTGVGTRPLKTAVLLFTFPEAQLSGYTSPVLSAIYNDNPAVTTYYRNLWRDMFTQSCDPQSIMPINEAWHAMSFGQLTMHGAAGRGGLDVFGFIHLTEADLAEAVDPDGCEDTTGAVIRAATAQAGFNPRAYDLVIYSAPLCSDSACFACTNRPEQCAMCGVALGWGETGRPTDADYQPGGIWIKLEDTYALDQQALLAHELGHRWYHHSSTVELDPATGQFQAQEYGDVISVMGSGAHYLVSPLHLLTAGFIPPSALSRVPVASLPALTSPVPPVGAGTAAALLLGQPGVFRLTNTHRRVGARLATTDVAALVVELPASAAWRGAPLPDTRYYSFVIQFIKDMEGGGWSSINRWTGQALFPTHGVWVALAEGNLSYLTGAPADSNAKMYAMFNDASRDGIVKTDMIEADRVTNAARVRAEMLITPGQTLTTQWTRTTQLRVTLLALDPSLEWAIVHVARGPSAQPGAQG